MSEWISIDDRYPKNHVTVLAVTESGWMCTCMASVLINDKKRKNPTFGKSDLFTHWMPLPEPPK